MLQHLKDITTSLKPVIQTDPNSLLPMLPSLGEDHDVKLHNWLLESLSPDRYRVMAANLDALCTQDPEQAQQRAKEIELLALKLDIDQANEIQRGRQFGIIKR